MSKKKKNIKSDNRIDLYLKIKYLYINPMDLMIITDNVRQTWAWTGKY